MSVLFICPGELTPETNQAALLTLISALSYAPTTMQASLPALFTAKVGPAPASYAIEIKALRGYHYIVWIQYQNTKDSEDVKQSTTFEWQGWSPEDAL